jgi:hypothetical protein
LLVWSGFFAHLHGDSLAKKFVAFSNSALSQLPLVFKSHH